MDTDAADYIERIEDDIQVLVVGAVKQAVDRFVRGCKKDPAPIPYMKNWDALRGCALMAGWPSWQGAFHQLRGPAKSDNFGFSPGDYDVNGGLKGDGESKYLVTGVIFNTLNYLDQSLGYFTTEPEGVVGVEAFGGVTAASDARFGIRSSGPNTKILEIGGARSHVVPATEAGFACVSKWGSETGQGLARYGRASYAINPNGFQSLATHNLRVFRDNQNRYTTARMVWYHYGAAVSPMLLELRVKQYLREITGEVVAMPRIYSPHRMGYAG